MFYSRSNLKIMRDNIKKSHAKTGLKPATVWSKIPFSLSFKKEFGGHISETESLFESVFLLVESYYVKEHLVLYDFKESFY